MGRIRKPKNSLPDPVGGEIVLRSARGGDMRAECLLREETND